jgi:hypothetical protein
LFVISVRYGKTTIDNKAPSTGRVQTAAADLKRKTAFRVLMDPRALFTKHPIKRLGRFHGT